MSYVGVGMLFPGAANAPKPSVGIEYTELEGRRVDPLAALRAQGVSVPGSAIGGAIAGGAQSAANALRNAFGSQVIGPGQPVYAAPSKGFSLSTPMLIAGGVGLVGIIYLATRKKSGGTAPAAV